MDLYLFNLVNPVKDFFSFINSLDMIIFNGVNQFASKNFLVDTLAIFFADFFQYVLILSLAIFLVVNFKKYWKMVIEALVSAVFARFAVNEIIQLFWQRPRPFVNNNVNLLFEHLGPSFPSGHAAFFFAISTIVFLYNKKAGLLFFLASIIISLARVFSGIHWPTDILVGAIVGVASGFLIYKLSKYIFRGQTL